MIILVTMARMVRTMIRTDDLDARIAKAVQTAVDRATNKLGNENKKLKDQLNAERKKNLSADELKKVELQEKEDAITQKENELKEKENRMYAIKALKKAELDDGQRGYPRSG